MIYSKGSGLNDLAFGKNEAKIKQYIEDADVAAVKNSVVRNIFPVVSSDDFGSSYGGQTTLGNFIPNGENAAYVEKDVQDDYDKTVLNNVTWKNSFSITREAVEDAKMGLGKKQSKAFINAYYNTEEMFGAKFLQYADASSFDFGGKTFSTLGGDGQPLFSTAHPYITDTGSTQSNISDAVFTYSQLSVMEIKMGQQRAASSDGGILLNIAPDTIILPTATSFDAAQLEDVLEALNGDGNPTTAYRGGNYHLGRWNVQTWKFLGLASTSDASKSWFMMCDMGYVNDNLPYMLQQRTELTVRPYIDDNTDAAVYTGRARYTAAVGSVWQGIEAAIFTA